MKQSLTTGFVPYEIGDHIVKGENIMVITDIKMISFVKDKKVQFEIELDGKKWVPLNELTIG